MHTHNTHSCGHNPLMQSLLTDAHKATAKSPIDTTHELAGEGHPNLIVIGRIVTMGETMPVAEAMAIKRGQIIAVGAASDIKKLAGRATTVIELGSKVVYPGFIESHMHLWVTAVNYDWLDCSAFANPTLEDVKKQIASAAATAKPGEWILGKLFDPSLLPGMPELTVSDLDPIAPNNPVFIMNASMHFAYVNSKALKLSNISADTPDPPGGAYGRDSHGEPNGILSEMSAIAPLLSHVDKITPDSIAKNVANISKDAAKVGVTTMREAATGALFGINEIGMLHRLHQKDQLKTRVSVALVDEVAQTWPASSQMRPGEGNDHVWVGARKIVSDGSNQGKSGYQSQPYLHSKERGALDIQPDELKKRIAWCESNGWQLMVHANGDAAVEMTVGAFLEVLGSHPSRGLRHRIEHCSLVNDDALFGKMKAAGITPSFLINHVYYWGETLRDNVIGQDRIYMLDRTAAASKAGLKFTLHSDYNVSPINPLHYVKVAATRTLRGSHEVLGTDQRVSVYKALRAITIDAAWQINADDRLGSITPGKFADFVILNKDPQHTEPDQIDTIIVHETWRAGRVTSKK